VVEVVYESNGGGGACLQGEYHADMRRKRKAAGLPSTMEPVAIHETRAKDACISGVVPLLNNGVAVLSTAIRSHEGGREALRQVEAWPGGAHDDGPDALAKALLRLESASTGGLSLADAERALSLFSRAAG
jgi:phage terminase large subunit-like protein